MTCNCGCSGAFPCGCCEGVEILTPALIANRPGLRAIDYRIGTHGAFLETMKACLSSADFSPLADLKTRDTNDTAIAFLDAWATVGDVLTFYQERIANEGYLGTATERRSILELARLVGYTLRPGVAASTYLAYTLDKPAAIPLLPGKEATAPPLPDPEVTIPEGSRAQSVPGPGELPQSFESSDDLVARASWNNLQVRLNQPQRITDRTRIIYLKGTPNLKPGDPILIIASLPRLCRVITVTPDPPADRTRITLQPWRRGSGVADGGLGTLGNFVEDVSLRFSAVENFGVVRTTKSANDVLAILEQARSHASAATSDEELKLKLQQEILPKLNELHEAAVKGNFTRVGPWVASLAREMDAAISETASGEPNLGIASKALLSSAARPVNNLTQVLERLTKPPSVPPSDPQRLPRSVQESFATDADLAPQLLTRLRPELESVLYKAWENISLTGAPTFEVHAFRTRASVFGNNAPLEPIKNKAGVITDTKEWNLQEFTTSTEPVEIDVEVSSAAGRDPAAGRVSGEEFSVTLKVAGNSTAKTPLKDGDNPIDFPKIRDSVVVNLSRIQQSVSMRFTFSTRQIVVTLDIDVQDMQVKFSSDPAGMIIEVDIGKATAEGSVAIVMKGQHQVRTETKRSEEPKVVWLDAAYDQIKPDNPNSTTTDRQSSWMAAERPNALLDSNGTEIIPEIVISRVIEVNQRSRASYGIAIKSTSLELDREWIDPGPGRDTFAAVRGTAVFVQSEQLELAEEPIETPVAGGELELDGLYPGLESGRWLIISGERTDIAASTPNALSVPQVSAETAAEPAAGIKGVAATELVMLARVGQRSRQDLPGDKTHTFLGLFGKLAYSYKRDSVIVYGNVVAATHGETRKEVLGNGDAGKGLQEFSLKQSPLTFVPAPNPAGVVSTLQVRVNDVLWRETDSLAGLGSNDHGYVTRTDDENKTSVIFGTGETGARLPTGQENITASYRNGIGKGGNLKPDQISLLASRPLGVKAVTNPMASSGGADRENRDQARRNAPLAVMALDRLVSTQDYADSARTFGGIGKAAASRLSDGQRRLVHITIAGADDIPIENTSDLYRNLAKALRDFGDPYLPVQVVLRKLLLLVIQANVRVLPEYLWEKVEPKIRTALLDTFSFERRELGQDALLSEAVSAIQSVEGVAYVDVDKFDWVDEDKVLKHLSGGTPLGDILERKERIPVALAFIDSSQDDPANRIRPAELAYLTPEVSDTVILSEITS